MLESTFVEIEGHEVHLWQGGTGFPVLMLHGVGPGTSIVGNYGPVLEPLAAHCRIVAADLIGFGESDRKASPPYFDVDLWVRQGLALIERLGNGPCGIAGHSLGGALALKIASRAPQITKVLTSSSIGAPYPLNEALDGFWSLPADRTELRRAMARMVHDPDAVTEDMIEGRWQLLESEGYAAYFGEMFAPPRQRYIDDGIVSAEELARIEADVVMLHGRDDQPCPAAETTLVVAEGLAQADIKLFGNCGHNLPRERTADYLAAATALFA
jgi:2-hydroxymuconate-semialdehyde hydrolase